MRHSDIKLTMNVYTDPKLLDVAGALDALPFLPLDGDRTGSEVVRATGTDDETARTLAPTPDNSGKSLSFSGRTFTDEPGFNPSGPIAVSGCADKKNEPLTSAVKGSGAVAPVGIEPTSPCLKDNGASGTNETAKGLTATAPNACTPACTSEAKSEQTDPVAALAAALLALSPSDRARLAVLLSGQAEVEGGT